MKPAAPNHEWVLDNCGHYCRTHEHECILPIAEHGPEHDCSYAVRALAKEE